MVAFHFYAVLLLAVSAGCRSDVLHSTAASLSRQLWDIFTNVSGTSVLHLEELLANQNAEPVNGTTIAQQAADDISSRLATVKEALHETAAAAERLYSRHQNQTCCDRACQYGTGYDADRCSVFCNVSSISYVSTGRQFGIETGENGTRQCVMGALEDDADSCPAVGDGMRMRESAVHIPRDMHEDDPAVLCFVQWTDPLIEQFSANFSLHDNSTIILQYVGSDTRLLRFSPPSDWLSLSQCERCPLTLQDTYELGRRPWYTNTVTGEKYIVILLDVSGSMAGFQSILARTTITELLKALTANDYFQIFQVGEGERSRPFRCFPNKTRATPENVLVMNHVLQSLPDLNNIGRAQFSSPLTTALTLLENSTVCHRVLIIFTDGERETELPFDLIRAYNEHKEIQVFTFLVGYGGDHANLETVACQNRGRMGRIKEYSDIIPAVLLITNSLEQPPPSPEVHYTSYRGVYGNLALTMGQPLWISDEIGNKSDSIGVVAVDLSHDALLETALRNHSIGASGYGFIVDNNGQLVNHPLISTEYLQGLSDDNLLSLDMDYYEHPFNKSQWLAVRRGILGGGWGHHSLLTWSTLEREEVYVLRNTTYSYAPISGTPYILVIVTPFDLWLVAPPTSPNGSSVFTLFSSEPEYQCTEENCEQYLKRVEGRPPTALSVVAAGGCGNESTALLKPLQLAAGQVVGVAGTTLSPGIMDQLLTNALREGGWGEEEVGEEGGWEVYVIDETANIVAAAPYQQRGWFPELYPAVQARLVANAVFRNGSIHGYELRPSQGAGEADCECESLELYLKAIEVYQLSGPAPVEPEEMACGDNGTLTLKVTATSIPNTTLTLVALSGPAHCLHGNKTDCSQRPIGFQCVPCVCGCQSCDLHRQNISCFYPPTKNVILCATITPHPSLLVVMAMSFITTMAWQGSWR